MPSIKPFRCAVLGLALSAVFAGAAWSQPAKPAQGPRRFVVEWVYRVKYGFHDEWWDLFRNYQIPVLERMKARGEIIDYKVYHPFYHVSEEQRWDYRVEITYRDQDAPAAEGPVTAEMFPDRKAFKAAELRRFELTLNHWDLPIYEVDVTKGR